MYLFVDTETNGLPRNWKAPVSDLQNWPRLVQVAWRWYSPEGELLGEADHIIRPEGFRVSAESARIHGISHDKALSEGIFLGEALAEFADKLRQSEAWVAHNAFFDGMILGAEFLRLGKSDLMAKTDRICTMHNSTDFCAIPGRYGNKWPTLAELHRILFDEDFQEAHNAKADIAATARCFWELRRLKVL